MDKKEKEKVFTKDQLLKSKKFADNKDAINAVLDKEKQYTIKEATAVLQLFMKGEK